MKSIPRTLQRLALAALTAVAFLAPAQAAPVVSINPASQNIAVGGPAAVDIVVSGLTQAVGGYSLTLAFNGTFLSGVSFFNNPDDKLGASPLDLSLGFSGGSLDLFVVADALISESNLAALQGASFTLARVNFLGLANGLSPLTLSNVNLSQYDGATTIAGVTSRNGQICVGTCINTVAEPTTIFLLATALGALGIVRRRAV